MDRSNDASTVAKKAPRVGRRLVVHSIAGSASWNCDSPVRVVTVGRDSACELHIDDPSLSRRHARITVTDIVEVEDLGSHNGTLVGGKPIPQGQRVRLNAGQPVELGDAIVLLMEPEHELEPQPVSRRGQGLVSPELERVHRFVELVARGTISVIVKGETGVGKEGIAERIHRASARRDHSFVAVNCASLSETLLESELFGHEKGSFTGATNARIGILESADKGTVFLDELGEMPSSVQVKLLRCIEKKEIVPVGSVRPRAIDVRFVAATHRDLEALIASGAFRADLYFRLNGMTIEVPPLRARPTEILPLARQFVAEVCAAMGAPSSELTANAARVLVDYRWPGNIRELKNAMERAVLLANGAPIDAEHVMLDARGSQASAPAAESANVAALSESQTDERNRIVQALQTANGNQTHAAQLLGLSRFQLMNRLKAYGLGRPRSR